MPVPAVEEVLNLAADLKEAKERVAELEAKWASFFTISSGQTITIPLVSLKSRIVTFLEQRPDLSFTTASVATSLDANENSVGPYLSDLAKEGRIERRDRGLYGAKKEVVQDFFEESREEAYRENAPM